MLAPPTLCSGGQVKTLYLVCPRSAAPSMLILEKTKAKNRKGSVPMKAKEPATPSVLKRRAGQKRYYERKKLSLKAEDREKRRLVKEERAARLAERRKQAEVRASEDTASLPARQLDK